MMNCERLQRLNDGWYNVYIMYDGIMCCPPRNVAQFWSGAHLQRGQPVAAAKESGLLQS